MQYIELDVFLKTANWKLVAEFFDNRIKQEIVDLVSNSQSITPEILRESQTKIECYREFIGLPSIVQSENEREKSSKDVKRR